MCVVILISAAAGTPVASCQETSGEAGAQGWLPHRLAFIPDVLIFWGKVARR